MRLAHSIDLVLSGNDVVKNVPELVGYSDFAFTDE